MAIRTQSLTKAKNELARHQFDYLVLITGAVFFLLGLRITRGERLESFLLVLIFASMYCVWGIIHHIRDNSLHLRIVLEYILISFSVVALLTLLIYH